LGAFIGFLDLFYGLSLRKDGELPAKSSSLGVVASGDLP